MSDEAVYATGKRKCAVARVWVKPGTGKFIVNKQPGDDYFERGTTRMIMRQAVKLLEHWLDNSLIGLWRPRTTSKGDTPEAVFLTNLTDPVDKAPVGGRDHCVISRHVDQADSRELQRWYDRLRDLERNGDQDRLEEIADVIMQSGKSGRKIRDLVFG